MARVEVVVMFGAPWWEAASAIGTVAAVAVALALAGVERARAQRAEEQLAAERARQQCEVAEARASMVAAWIEVAPVPSPEGNYYQRVATVHLANESDAPVYNVNLCVGLQESPDNWVRVGPLSVPQPVPVLASRSKLQWDITMPLMACSAEFGDFLGGPMVALTFSDAAGQRWTRDFDLVLVRHGEDGTGTLFNDDPAMGEEQVGDLANPFNPMGTVFLFLSALGAGEGGGEPDWDLMMSLVDESAEGWSRASRSDWTEKVHEWRELGLAAHAHYPAPRVAYVKALTDEAAAARLNAAGYVPVPVTIFTLRFVAGLGWRIFSIGAPTRADLIEFPEGGLDGDPKTPFS